MNSANKRLLDKIRQIQAGRDEPGKKLLWQSFFSFAPLARPLLLAYLRNRFWATYFDFHGTPATPPDEWIGFFLRLRLLTLEKIADDSCIEPAVVYPSYCGQERTAGRNIVGGKRNSDPASGAFVDEPCVSRAEDLAGLPLPEPVFQKPAASEMAEYQRCLECAEGLVGVQPPDTNPKPWDATFSPFGGACKMLGHENLLLAMYDDPALVHAAMDWLCRARIHYERQRGALMGYDVKSIEKEWAEDDVNAPFISRALYKEFVFPYEQQTARELGNTHYHSCGNITPFADLIVTLPGLVQVDVSACSDLKTIALLAKGRRIRLRKSPHVMSEVLEADEAQIRRNIRGIISAAQGVNTFILCEGFYDGQPGTLEKVGAWTRIAHAELLARGGEAL